MDLIINIIVSIVFTIIDIYILKFYFESKEINIFNSHYLFFPSGIFLFLSNWHMPKNYILNFIFFIIALSLIILILPTTKKFTLSYYCRFLKLLLIFLHYFY